MRFIFLYTELADYVVHCFEQLALKNNEVHVVRWETNAEAPFQFKNSERVKLYSRRNFKNKEEILKLVETINPNVIICSGWIDKLYLQICADYKGKIPTVLTLDNHWTGNVKQILATVISPFFLKTKFSHAWVPGEKQFQYALKLGFDASKINRNFYCANVSLFAKYYTENKETKEEKFPHVFLYVGRYVKHKGIFDLWQAFIELQQEHENDWELWCVGTGDQFDSRVKHLKIKHFGFLQPNEMNAVIKGAGVYVLPSHFEPWGVTLQEFSVAGFPVLCSDKVGSSEVFLEEKVNGFSFPSHDIEALKNSMKKIINMTNISLVEFQKQSSLIGMKINPDLWVNTLTKISNA